MITIVCSKAVDFKTGFDFSGTFQEISFAQKKIHELERPDFAKKSAHGEL